MSKEDSNPWKRAGGPAPATRAPAAPAAGAASPALAPAGSGGAPGSVAATAERREMTTTDHLRVALRAADETESTAAGALSELQSQGEQIDRIQRRVDEVDAHVERSHFILRGMTSVFSTMSNAFRKKPETPREVLTRKEEERAAAEAKLQVERDVAATSGAGTPATAASGGKGAAGASPLAAGGGSGAGATATPRTGTSSVLGKKEDLDLLAAVSASLSNTRAIGVEMRGELDRQDVKLTQLNSDIDRTTDKLQSADARARRLAR